MEIPVEKTTHEQAGNVLGSIAAANVAEAPKKTPSNVTFRNKTAQAVTGLADPITDLVHKIENLKKPDAIARLAALEEAQERTYFEIGGVLSVMQKEKWYDPYASLDEWVEKNTGMKRSKARALIQIYDAIVNSEVKWAQVQHIKWTKLRAVAGVLNKENVGHWIGIASKHPKREINELVKKHHMASGAAMAGGSTGTHIRNFKLHDAQKKTIDAALEKAKATSGTSMNSVALELICLHYVGGQTLQQRLAVLGPQALAKTFADVLNAISTDAATAVIKSVYQNVTHALQAD
jgi:hypothetical protein